MAKTAFSDAGLRSLPPPAKGQISYWDEKLPSFGLRVSQGGSKTFILKRQNSFITIGRFGILTLSDARTEAKRMLAEFTLGKVRPQSITYQKAVELFLQEKTKGRRSRTVADYKRLLNRFNFKGQLADLTHQELQRRIKRFTSEGEYNHLLVALKVFLNWAIKRRYIEHNPTLGLSTHQLPTRARVLADAEIKSIWLACDSPSPDLPPAFRTIVKLLILTGQRRGEIAGLRADFIQGELCTLPPTLTKNGREHTFPLAPTALSLLSRSLTTNPTKSSTVIFAARGKPTAPFNGWSKAKTALDKLSEVKDWTLHDFRRTFATNLAQMAVPPHVIERLLNHITGTVSGVAAVYNRAAYMEEMRAAIHLWETKLNSLSL